MSLSFARATPSATRVGWIGAGVMGCSMAGHLIDAGYPLTVFNRTAAKCDPLVAKGAQLATSPAEVASASDVVFSIVGYPRGESALLAAGLRAGCSQPGAPRRTDVRNVILGEDGALGSLREGSVLVDMTTSEPSLAVEISEAAAARGVGSLDAPVSGGDVGAREAKLAIMVGGEQSAYDAVLPLFELMGKNSAPPQPRATEQVVWDCKWPAFRPDDPPVAGARRAVKLMGPAGAGQHTKMANQIMIATNMIGVVVRDWPAARRPGSRALTGLARQEGLLYAYRAGLDMEDVIAAIGSGAAGSFSLNVLGGSRRPRAGAAAQAC